MQTRAIWTTDGGLDDVGSIGLLARMAENGLAGTLFCKAAMPDSEVGTFSNIASPLLHVPEAGRRRGI